MGSLVINCSSSVDIAELAALVGPGFIVMPLPLVSKGLTGEEVALSLALGVAANASYAVIREAAAALIDWLSSRTSDNAADKSSMQISVSGRGTTVRVLGNSNKNDVVILIDDWIEQSVDDE